MLRAVALSGRHVLRAAELLSPTRARWPPVPSSPVVPALRRVSRSHQFITPKCHQGPFTGPLAVSSRSFHAIARGMRGCSQREIRKLLPTLQGARSMAYHKDGLNKVPGWMVNLVVAIVGVGALAVLFTVGLGAIALAAVAVAAWMLYSTVFPAVRAFTSTRGTGSGDLVASLRRARSGTGGSSRASRVLRLMRDSVVLSVGSTLLMGQYASFTLGEVAESVLNGHVAFARRYGPVMVVVQGEPENEFVEVKGTDGAVADKLPSLVLKGIAMDGRGQPLGQVRLVATYDSLDVQEERSWAQWAHGKKRSMTQLWEALRGGGSGASQGGSKGFAGDDDEEPDFGPDFMRKLKEAVLDMPEFEFTLREMSFTSGQFDPLSKTWSEPPGGAVNFDLTPHIAGDVKRAVDHIPGEHVVQSALSYMGGSGAGEDDEVRRGLTDIYRAFVQRREEAYARAERERSGVDDAEQEDLGEGSDHRQGRGRSQGGRGGGSSTAYSSAQHTSRGRGSGSGGGGGSTILDAEFTVQRGDPHAENR